MSYASLPGTQTGTPATASATTSLTTFTSSFSTAGHAYTYRMVGTNPATSSATTRTPVTIIPIKIVLSNGFYTYPATAPITGSALFNSASFSSGTTQYADAMQRAEFWKYTSTTTYHSLLGTPVVHPQAVINVPASSGQELTTSSGVNVAGINMNYLDSLLRSAAATYPANTLPLFVTYDTVLYQGSVSNCCVFGYHSAVSTSSGNHTYAYGAWEEPAAFGANWSELVTDSHEISEWFNDPYVNNAVPHWTSPLGAQYGCSSVLEVGDPVAGHAFTLTTKGVSRHYQDETFFSWFTRTKPSIGINGRYTYLNTFTSYSPSC